MTRSPRLWLEEIVEAADLIVIGLPIYNFGVPAALKAWIDMVARARLTFQVNDSRTGEGVEAALGLLAVPAPYIGGLLYDQVGPEATFVVAAICALIAAPLCALLRLAAESSTAVLLRTTSR